MSSRRTNDITLKMPHKAVFRPRELEAYLAFQREKQNIVMRISEMTHNLLLKRQIESIALRSEYGNELRYITNSASDISIALSIDPKAYLSHRSAAETWGFLDQSSMIYVNREQSPKKTPTNPLTQEAIDRAYSNNQRKTNLIYRFRNTKLAVLNGKFTNELGVVKIRRQGEEFRVTNAERTLIDAVVRPDYIGSNQDIQALFTKAADSISTSKIARILKRLDYRYPFHQSLGFLLELSGIPQADLEPLRTNAFSFNFYLRYGMKSPRLDRRWKLYVPQGMY